MPSPASGDYIVYVRVVRSKLTTAQEQQLVSGKVNQAGDLNLVDLKSSLATLINNYLATLVPPVTSTLTAWDVIIHAHSELTPGTRRDTTNGTSLVTFFVQPIGSSTVVSSTTVVNAINSDPQNGNDVVFSDPVALHAATPTSTSNPTVGASNGGDSSNVNYIAIALALVGGIIAGIMLLALIFYIRKRKGWHMKVDRAEGQTMEMALRRSVMGDIAQENFNEMPDHNPMYMGADFDPYTMYGHSIGSTRDSDVVYGNHDLLSPSNADYVSGTDYLEVGSAVGSGVHRRPSLAASGSNTLSMNRPTSMMINNRRQQTIMLPDADDIYDHVGIMIGM